MRTLKAFTILLLTGILSCSLTACANTPETSNSLPDPAQSTASDQPSDPVQPTASAPASSTEEDNSGSSYFYGSSRTGRWWRGYRVTKYTQADYDLAVSFASDGYQKKTVAEFDLSVMDWNDEDAYHKMEETLRRLFYSLPEDDKNAEFIYGTLSNTWDACEKKHYETCDREKNPWHNSSAEYETFGDVYGDQVMLTGAYADFDFDYTIGDETAVTVGERDTLLESVSRELTQFMSRQSEEKLSDEEAMEKTLETELKKLLQSMGNGNLKWGGQCSLSYWWDAPWKWYLEDYLEEYKTKEKNKYEEEDEEEPPRGFTQEQYREVLQKFQYGTYKEMTVADFDRLANNLLSPDTEEDEEFAEVFEYVCSYLDREDNASNFLLVTIPMALKEYEARACSVYSGKQCDPAHYDRLSLQRTEDVFGDQVPVEILEGDYTLTYRILDATKLTVGQRDQFFEELQKEASEILTEAMKNDQVTEKDFENAFTEAGKKVGNDLIIITGIETDYLYTDNFN